MISRRGIAVCHYVYVIRILIKFSVSCYNTSNWVDSSSVFFKIRFWSHGRSANDVTSFLLIPLLWYHVPSRRWALGIGITIKSLRSIELWIGSSHQLTEHSRSWDRHDQPFHSRRGPSSVMVRANRPCCYLHWRDCIRFVRSVPINHSDLHSQLGVHISVYLTCSFYLLKSRTRRFQTWLIFVFLLFALGTVNICFNMHFGQMVWIDNRNYPGGPYAYLVQQEGNTLLTAGDAESILVSLLADGLLVRSDHYYLWKWAVILALTDLALLCSISFVVVSYNPNFGMACILW